MDGRGNAGFLGGQFWRYKVTVSGGLEISKGTAASKHKTRKTCWMDPVVVIRSKHTTPELESL